MNTTIQERVQEILHNPILGAHCHDPTCCSVKSIFEAGGALMEPVGKDPHVQRYMFTKKVEDSTKEVPDYMFEERFSGYWQHTTSSTLFLQDRFRGGVPVWQFVLQGQFLKQTIDCFEIVMEMLLRSSRPKHRQKFPKKYSPRGYNLLHNNHEYAVSIAGDHSHLVGNERVYTKGELIFSAQFMAQTLVGVSM